MDEVTGGLRGEALLGYVRENVIGVNAMFHGPFGPRKIVYCDYVASGKPLRFLEEFIWHYVYPYYANTHTTTSIVGLQTTRFRQDAREIIKKCVNASEEDVVIFTGSGATGCIHKLINGLRITDGREHNTTVIFGPYEHHSNILPWREAGVKTERIRETFHGTIDMEDLENRLAENHRRGRELIVTMSAASNVTGIKTDTVRIAQLCHKYGAIVIWDYAAGAPYIPIDMNPTKDGYKDAVIISPHKFVGGPGTPGVLVAKKKLFRNKVPGGVGGGTVVFVTRESHWYIDDIEEREEGGTPAIIESIRAGLVFQLKQNIGPVLIENIEADLVKRSLSAWKANPNMVILGSLTAERLPIFSFLVRNPESGKLLHHNFVAAVLNDVFGIQARGGCACAGPYAQDLLSMDEDMATKFTWFLTPNTPQSDGILRIKEPLEIMKPGFTRLNMPYFFDDRTVDYIIHAVDMVATFGWKLMPLYRYNPRTSEWHHQDKPTGVKINSLHNVIYQKDRLVMTDTSGLVADGSQDLQTMSIEADILFIEMESKAKDMPVREDDLDMPEDQRHLVWFLQPSQALLYLQHPSLKLLPLKHTPLPYSPRKLSLKRARRNWKRIVKTAAKSAAEQRAQENGIVNEQDQEPTRPKYVAPLPSPIDCPPEPVSFERAQPEVSQNEATGNPPIINGIVQSIHADFSRDREEFENTETKEDNIIILTNIPKMKDSTVKKNTTPRFKLSHILPKKKIVTSHVSAFKLHYHHNMSLEEEPNNNASVEDLVDNRKSLHESLMHVPHRRKHKQCIVM